MVQVTETAKRRPGKCVLSGETQGPFIDTGKTIPRYGRVYISLKWLKQPLRELGFLPKEEVEEILAEYDNLEAEVNRLSEIESDHLELVEAVTPYLPTPDPEIREVKVVQERKPTDEEIASWIESNGGNHPAVLKARPAEKGSSEEWFGLYGETGPQPQPKSVDLETEGTDEESLENEPSEDTGPDQVVIVFDQEVDLDKVLAQNVGDVVSFAEGKGEDFEAALIRREFFLAEKDERTVRKGVLEPLGYWDDEDNEPLYPADDEEEVTDPEEESEDETLSLDENDEEE